MSDLIQRMLQAPQGSTHNLMITSLTLIQICHRGQTSLKMVSLLCVKIQPLWTL